MSFSNKYIFLDTNVFIHCKDFTRIQWKNLFKELKITINLFIPEIVLDELDDLKYKNGRIKEIISKIRRNLGKEIQENVYLKIFQTMADYNNLDLKIKSKLRLNKNDHLILIEILKFLESHNINDTYFITGDSGSEIKALSLGIQTIYWLDDKYINNFEKIKEERSKPIDLLIFFNNEKKIINYPDNCEKINKMEYPTINIPQGFINTEELIDLSINYGVSAHDIHPSGSGQWSSSINNLNECLDDINRKYNPNIKTIAQFKKEIDEFNKFIKNLIKVNLIIKNNGRYPYTDVTIEIRTELEKGFDIFYLKEIPRPVGPFSLERKKDERIKHDVFSTMKIEKKIHGRKIKFKFGYKIKKIQHGIEIFIEPILIKIPANRNARLIQFSCSFYHNEPGKIKDQSLKINLN